LGAGWGAAVGEVRLGRRRAGVHCGAGASGDLGALGDGWRGRARGIAPGGSFPAKEHCSSCGLCETYYVSHVKEACAFLGDGMSRVESLEASVHGRGRRMDPADPADELHFGVTREMVYAKVVPAVEGAQWTGVVTSVACAMLREDLVDCVVAVGSDPEGADPLAPVPVVCTTEAEVMATRGVKPSLSPSLNVLAHVEAAGHKRMLFVGVGCQVSALRAVEPYLREAGMEEIYVMGTNCVDNGPLKGFKKFLSVASDEPETVTGYEFMQDYNVHFKHRVRGSKELRTEKVPYFCLPADQLKDVIAPSCYSCFDYTNGLADLVVGYMGVPYQGVPMTEHSCYVTSRNAKGSAMLDLVRPRLEVMPTQSSGDRKPFVLETVKSDDAATLGAYRDPAPRNVGRVIAYLLGLVGPKGLEFARYSLDYHWIRNWIYVQRNYPEAQAEAHVPEYAKRVVRQYDADGSLTALAALGKNIGVGGNDAVRAAAQGAAGGRAGSEVEGGAPPTAAVLAAVFAAVFAAVLAATGGVK